MGRKPCPQNLFGVTYIVLAPEHSLVDIITKSEHKIEVDGYIAESMRKSNIQRMIQETGKTGVFTEFEKYDFTQKDFAELIELLSKNICLIILKLI